MSDIVIDAFRSAFRLADDYEISDELAFEQIAGWDSVGHMNLVAELEKRLGLTLEMDEIITMDSVAAVRQLVAQKEGLAKL